MEYKISMTGKNGQQPTVVRTNRGLSVAGTRLTLYSIMDYVKAGKPPEVIRDHFRLTIKQTSDILAYIETHPEEVEAEYQQVLNESEANRQYWETRNKEKLAQIEAMPPKPGQETIRAKLKAAKEKLRVK